MAAFYSVRECARVCACMHVPLCAEAEGQATFWMTQKSQWPYLMLPLTPQIYRFGERPSNDPGEETIVHRDIGAYWVEGWRLASFPAM